MEDNQLLERLSAEVHNGWWDEKKKQGFHTPLNCPHRSPTNEYGKFEAVCEKCHADMYPYEELAENIKEYDRVMVRTCLKAIEDAGYEVKKKQEDSMNPEIEKRFTYHAPKPGQPEKYVQLRDKCKELAYLIDELCPDSREKSLALTKIEAASMWANAAIARNG